jgi:AraC-like DNA-binding protein
MVESYGSGIMLNFFIRKSTFDEIFFNMLTSGDAVSHFFISNLFFTNPIKYLRFDTKGDPEIYEHIFTMLMEQEKNNSYSKRIMNDLVSILFAKLMRKYSVITDNDHTDRNPYAELVTYIAGKFRTITIEEAARHAGISVAHCSRIIKNITGKNFTKLIRQIAIHQAKTLLIKTNMKIHDISYSLGYENPETFIRNFQKECAVTPGRYRQIHAAEKPGND